MKKKVIEIGATCLWARSRKMVTVKKRKVKITPLPACF